MQPRILICPLDWGLGHATRCVPIIRLLVENKINVIIAGEGRSLEILKNEFPKLEYITFSGYSVSYPKSGSFALKMLISLPKLFWRINKEHRFLKKIIAKKRIDCVISDNRFGLWNKNIKTIFITHQLMIKSPFAEKLLHQLNLFFIKKYTDCWIPDEVGSYNLSGDLAHLYPLPQNAHFIGILSRFTKIHFIKTYNYDVMAIVSGPEPQRSVFEKLIVKEISKLKLKALIVCGKPELSEDTKQIDAIEIKNHLNASEMQQAISNSQLIIARSGYSTLMDLAFLNKRCLFVPTPGQTEQEYLATCLMKNNIAYFQNQHEFDLQSALEESKKYLGFTKDYDSEKLVAQINKLVMSLS